MTTYPLAGPALLEPFWFGTVRHGQQHAIVSSDGSTVTAEGVDLDAAATARRAAQDAATLAQRWVEGKSC